MKKRLYLTLLLLLIGTLLSALAAILMLAYGFVWSGMETDFAERAFLHPILLLFLLLLLLSPLVATLIATCLVRPIVTVDPKHPPREHPYPELRPVLDRLDRVDRRLHRQMSEMLSRRSEFDTLTAHMSEGMIIFNDCAEILTCNRSARLLFGLDEGTVPKSILTLRATEGFRNAVSTALAGENGYDVMENGGKYYSILATPIIQEGNVEGAVLMLLDVTEKEERERLRREFTANISHELKTPLTSISGFAELIEKGIADGEDSRRFAGNIYTEAQRLITLVGDIIRLSQLDGGEFAFDENRLDLYAIAEEVLGRLGNVAEKQGVSLRLAGEHVGVAGNLQIVSLMIYNLVENGIQYNRAGGHVEVFVARAEGGVLLRVSDSGIGIPPEAQSRVFERFFRVDKSHSKENGGTGLGLSIVKHAAARHHARLSLTSEVGKGTEVSLVFPCPEACEDPCSEDRLKTENK